MTKQEYEATIAELRERLDDMQHQFEPNECNCPRGKVLALLEVE